MLTEMRELAVQPVIAARSQPVRRVVPVAVWRAEVKFDRQFQMMRAVTVT